MGFDNSLRSASWLLAVAATGLMAWPEPVDAGLLDRIGKAVDSAASAARDRKAAKQAQAASAPTPAAPASAATQPPDESCASAPSIADLNECGRRLFKREADRQADDYNNREEPAPQQRKLAPVTGNPFEPRPQPPGRQAYTLTGEEAQKIRDNLPGFAAPPEGALVADLTHGLGTGERARRLQAALAYLMTPQGVTATYRYKQDPSVFDTLMAVFEGAPPAERAQLLGEMFLQMMRVPVFDAGGQRRPLSALAVSPPLQPSASIASLPLWQKLQPAPAPAFQPNAFYAQQPGPLDCLYRVLVVQRPPEPGTAAFIVERYVPFEQLRGVNLAERAPDGGLVLGGVAMGEDGGSLRSYLGALGYFGEFSEVGSAEAARRLVYRAPRPPNTPNAPTAPAPAMTVYDTGVIKLAQQEARREMLKRTAAARLADLGGPVSSGGTQP
jgi:hypothetical protein